MTVKPDNNEELEKVLKHLTDIVKELTPFLKDFNGDFDMFSDDETAWNEIKKIIPEIYSHLSNSMYLLSNDLYCRAVGFYYFVKEASDNGDAGAKKVFNEIRPFYHQCLMENCNTN